MKSDQDKKLGFEDVDREWRVVLLTKLVLEIDGRCTSEIYVGALRREVTTYRGGLCTDHFRSIKSMLIGTYKADCRAD